MQEAKEQMQDFQGKECLSRNMWKVQKTKWIIRRKQFLQRKMPKEEVWILQKQKEPMQQC